MSKPHYYWFGHFKNMMRRYPFDEECSVQEQMVSEGIKMTIEQTNTLPDGAERIKLIEMVFFQKTLPVCAAAMALHISERTAQRWISNFVHTAAEKSGWIK